MTGHDLLSAMHSRPDGSDGRKSAQFWVVTDWGSVQKGIGWECNCNPNQGGYWWFPDFGQSMLSGTHCFHSKQEAIATLRSQLMAKLKALDEVERRNET